jgi:hypothetical protein
MSSIFAAILASLLDEDWTTPNITELRFARDDCLLGRTTKEGSLRPFRCVKAGLIRTIQEFATVADLDGDELGYLLVKVAEIKSMN